LEVSEDRGSGTYRARGEGGQIVYTGDRFGEIWRFALNEVRLLIEILHENSCEWIAADEATSAGKDENHPAKKQ
jgi:hypothetical protein